MKRIWQLFSQTVTVVLAAYFVVATLQPQWVNRNALRMGSMGVALLEAPPTPAGSTSPGSLSGAARKASPAVVSINTSKISRQPRNSDPWHQFFFGNQGAPQQQSGLGSGVIVSAEGYILTNNHVVESADEIEVTLNDSRTTQARVIGTDPDTDLAVLKIDVDRLPAIVLGNSDTLQVGDQVLAIGNPFGVGQTVTSGIVSALGRNQLGINTFENFIQTDAAINPGNSGGALVDVNGNLLGINTAIYSRSGGSMGIGFAIPVSTARQVLDSIVKDGRVTRGWIGVEPNELSAELAETFGIQPVPGVIITGVLQNGPAAQAGIRPGDVIVQVAGQAVHSVPELLSRVSGLTPGQAAPFSLLRQGKTLQAEVTPGVRPKAHPTARR
ncbi:MAG: Do family serine endopeptidase [Curvibacter lanceolatus]|jgi:Do/DeqQ family serine protease|uniref:S1C family serine protease n=1 Tax=Curvibacter lanceolatus TaxID=86182 RepID=UPI0004CE9764|nr:Do family serine endopeptidase [Curvibacter lanceolatus]MBV5292763.1 Do family serine endopeptidase [Curvibacter lanceolatus]